MHGGGGNNDLPSARDRYLNEVSTTTLGMESRTQMTGVGVNVHTHTQGHTCLCVHSHTHTHTHARTLTPDEVI